MSSWIVVAVTIEGLALIGALSVLATGRTLIAFLVGFNTMAAVTGIFVWYGGAGARAILVVGMVALYLVRINWMLLVWSDNTAVAKLDEKTPPAGKIMLPVVLANTAGWGYCLPFYFAVADPSPIGGTDFVAVAVYLIGTVVHFGSDYQKRRFKLRAGSGGRLLDTGFWALSRHPNYFGDFLIYVSFAIVSGHLWGWIAPLLNLLQYLFDAIPKNERWAAQRYGDDWLSYRSRTKSFAPYLF